MGRRSARRPTRVRPARITPGACDISGGARRGRRRRDGGGARTSRRVACPRRIDRPLVRAGPRRPAPASPDPLAASPEADAELVQADDYLGAMDEGALET